MKSNRNKEDIIIVSRIVITRAHCTSFRTISKAFPRAPFYVDIDYSRLNKCNLFLRMRNRCASRRLDVMFSYVKIKSLM